MGTVPWDSCEVVSNDYKGQPKNNFMWNLFKQIYLTSMYF